VGVLDRPLGFSDHRAHVTFGLAPSSMASWTFNMVSTMARKAASPAQTALR
jgi:hypothetical protein